tara:strand:+ start:67 stop:627 length:561 start_codon:yes stop_codon:yes gene_type:complete
MRIISGQFKGKKIFFTNSSITRPLRDFVKENIFNLLSHTKKFRTDFNNLEILDLYSGVGSFGIECLSRNVNKVVFVEKDPTAFSILKKNILKLDLSVKVELNNIDIDDFIERPNIKKFDLIFLDPPYKDVTYLEIVKKLKKKKIFKDKHTVIVHREKNSEEKINNLLKISLIKNYGRSKIIFGSFK